jgi:hypothetical protein
MSVGSGFEDLKSKLARAIMIVIVCCMITIISYSCRAEEYLKYPGNGSSHISKNKPIKELNAEIQRQAVSNARISFSKDRMHFHDVTEFEFKSSRAVIGPQFCLRVPLSIDTGSCAIKIGEVTYLISEEGFKVKEKGKVVFETKKEKPVDIVAEVFSPSNSSTRFHSKQRLIEIVNVSFSEPAVISIILNNNCSGWIGPWEWLRGYE